MVTTILFADDQIPEDKIPDQEISEAISQKYDGKVSSGFVRAFVKMRGIVGELRERGYDVTVANTYSQAMNLAATRHFDIAVIDLGWFGDLRLARDAQSAAGWNISAEIDKAEARRSAPRKTAQIIYSSRFARNPTIGEMATKRGALPFYKVYSVDDSYPVHAGTEPRDSAKEERDRDAANRNSLAAAVGFIEHLISAPGTEMNAALDVLADARKSEKRWETMTIGCIIASVVLVAISVVSVAVFDKPVTIVSAVAGAVTGLVPAFFFDQLKASRKQIDGAMKRLHEVGASGKPG